jgi:FMN reductase
MKILIVSCSLREASLSRVLANRVRENLEEFGAETSFVDLRETELPLCDAGSCYGHPNAIKVKEEVGAADGVIVAGPIYNYTCNAACKNFVELTGKSWENKVVGFLCAAGGDSSYMSIMGLANSLMLDFRCLIVPRFVYITGAAFEDGELVDVSVASRVKELASVTISLAKTNVTDKSS